MRFDYKVAWRWRPARQTLTWASIFPQRGGRALRRGDLAKTLRRPTRPAWAIPYSHYAQDKDMNLLGAYLAYGKLV
jgi:hypothetical protein